MMMYVRYPLSLRRVEDLMSERGIDICHGTVRFWCQHRAIFNGTRALPAALNAADSKHDWWSPAFSVGRNFRPV